jgi:delta1-piperideine-2-carboxylate reductase
MSVVNSYHLAALWHEAEALAARDLIAIVAVNSKPAMAPFNGNKALLGTNPICFAWPRPGHDPVVFDMATTSMAKGEVQIAANEGRVVPKGTGVNATGQDTTDPAEILQGLMLPFGGHKGAQIALMVELLAAGATGERFGFENQQLIPNDDDPLLGGELILALSPKLLAKSDWAVHCDTFFAAYNKIDGARLPGSKRYRQRSLDEGCDVDTKLLQKIQALCD